MGYTLDIIRKLFGNLAVILQFPRLSYIMNNKRLNFKYLHAIKKETKSKRCKRKPLNLVIQQLIVKYC